MKSLLIAIIICWAALAPAQAQEFLPPEKGKQLWSRAQKALKQGKELKACRIIQELGAMDPKSPLYKDIDKSLLSWGISISDPLGSYTIKRLVALQNKLEAKRRRLSTPPLPGLQSGVKDGWNRAVRVELVARPGWVYLIRSSGADRIFLTDDDYVIAVRDDTKRVKKSAPDIAASARREGKRSVMTRQGKSKKSGPTTPAIKNKSSGEVEVNLDDLMNP